MKHEKEFSLTIDKMVSGGYGLGRLDSGKVVLVENVIPGEKVLVRPRQDKKDFVLATPLRLLTSSPHRVQPPCPFYAECGGCDMQHIDYDMQPVFKKRIVADLFVRNGLPARLLEESAVPSDIRLGYRQRIRLHVDGQKRVMGFHRRHSHNVQELGSCMLAPIRINTVLGFLGKSSLFLELLPLMEVVELHLNPSSDKVILQLHWSRRLRPAERRSVERIAGAGDDIAGIYVIEKGGRRLGPFGANSENLRIEFSVPLGPLRGKRNLHFRVEPGGFSQVNLDQNRKMVLSLMEWADEAKSRTILDLHCGMGNFALPLAVKAHSVCGVDLQRASIRAAGENAARNGLQNCRFIRNAAEEAIRHLLSCGEKFDTVILDPPRSGCLGVMDSLPALQVRNIIYVSCDAATLGRDLARAASQGYRPIKVRLFDMFPQTHHIETAVLLTKSAQ